MVWKMIFRISIGWFLGSMLIFRGVFTIPCHMGPSIFLRIKTEIMIYHQPTQCIIGKSLKMTIRLYCLIPPIWVIEWSLNVESRILRKVSWNVDGLFFWNSPKQFSMVCFLCFATQKTVWKFQEWLHWNLPTPFQCKNVATLSSMAVSGSRNRW